MKKILVLTLSLLLLASLCLIGCEKNDNGKQASGETPEVTENENNETVSAKAHVIEGWPEDIPAPDFGGEIDEKILEDDRIFLIFRNIEPKLVAQYMDKLYAAGFTIIVNQDDRQLNGFTDEAGNPVLGHRFNAGKGELGESEVFDSIKINGYFIQMYYTDVDEYNAEDGQFASPPMAQINLAWGDLDVQY